MPRPMSPSRFIKHCSVLALFCVLVVGGGFAQPRTGTVTIAAPADEATNVQAGASMAAGILKRDSLQRLPLPTARVDQALPLIPGVVRSSTGEISIEGATEQQSTLLVNGLNASDPA